MEHPSVIPESIKRLIDDMLNRKDSVFVRGNYRLRLDAIQTHIQNAITKYDSEIMHKR